MVIINYQLKIIQFNKKLHLILIYLDINILIFILKIYNLIHAFLKIKLNIKNYRYIKYNLEYDKSIYLIISIYKY